MVCSTKGIGTAMAAVIAAGAVAISAAHLAAQSPENAVLLILDKHAIEYGVEPYQVPPDALNDLIAAVGVRDPLPFFAANVGRQFILRTGTEGNDSWFALQQSPGAWDSESGANDSLQNFVLAGPGLGSPDSNGERESLLGAVEGVMPVRAANAALLVGRAACAVIYDDDLSVPAASESMRLQGANLGVMGFRVASVVGTGTQWPGLMVELLDARATCSEHLELLVPSTAGR